LEKTMSRIWNSVVTVLLFAAPAQADIIFQLVSTDPSVPQNGAAGVVVLPYARGAGLTAAAGTTFNSQDFAMNANDAVAGDDYIEWGFVSPTVFNLSSFNVRYDRSPTGPTEARIEFKTTVGAGGSFQTVFSDNDISVNGENNLSIDLSSFDNVTSGTFRLIAWGATSPAGTLDFENSTVIGGGPLAVSFQLEGTIAAIPEPSTFSLIAVCVLLTSRTRSLRRTQSLRL
jgi:hypothetical protein